MATQLIKHLENCAKDDAIYQPLVYQWGFDEKLIAKALQGVSAYFPHYSRHDESHSRQILVHIERLLGDNISKLTATDTWLLLESAYLHDIGMIITDEQLNKNFDAIKEHAQNLKYSASDDLLKVINALITSKENTASAIFAQANIPAFQTLKLLREIIADYYRKKHPEQAGKIINNPFSEIGLDSPRNELLPARFFKLVGKICEYHGADFKTVMELPQKQVGMGTDDCHPRFIACLLRLGDLLDLDDNRFCPVMMKMAGDLPYLSEAHHQKHLAIRHFCANPERIEITAECPDYESYIQTTLWFSWLREEIKNQMSRWFDIVPAREFGLLPTVGDLKAQLKDWQVFSENQRPQFSLDKERIFELLQGAGLYESKEQAMRELLQNAVDATLIRIWREYGEQGNNQIKQDSAPREKEVRDILDKYSIDVSINKIEPTKKDDTYNYWRVEIKDSGTGISRDDLKFMLEMGSSKNNRNKRKVIEKMPVWMKPSGIFGIGLHSVFLLSEEVLIETRSIDTGETLVIRLTNPTDNKEHGNVYFRPVTEKILKDDKNNPFNKNISPWNFSEYGCKLSFVYKTDKNVILHDFYNDAINKIIQNHDELLDLADDLIVKKLELEILSFHKYCYLQMSIKQTKLRKDTTSKKKQRYHYSVSNKLEILDMNNNSLNNIFYRGQPFKESKRIIFNFFSISINLLDDEADTLLNISRNDFKSSYGEKDLFNRVHSAVQELFNDKAGENFYTNLDNKLKIYIAAEYKLLNFLAPKYFIEWDEFEVETTNKEIKKIKELKDFNTIILMSNDYRITEYHISDTSYLENYVAIRMQYPIKSLHLICAFLKEYGFKSMLELYSINVISKRDNEPISTEMVKKYCNSLFSSHYKQKRNSIPCLSEYQLLVLNNPNILPSLKGEQYNIEISCDFDLDLISPRMLFPLANINGRITVGDIDILAQRVHLNRANKEATVEQIKEKYQHFIAYLDDLMKEDDKWCELRGDEYGKYKNAE